MNNEITPYRRYVLVRKSLKANELARIPRPTYSGNIHSGRDQSDLLKKLIMILAKFADKMVVADRIDQLFLMLAKDSTKIVALKLLQGILASAKSILSIFIKLIPKAISTSRLSNIYRDMGDSYDNLDAITRNGSALIRKREILPLLTDLSKLFGFFYEVAEQGVSEQDIVEGKLASSQRQAKQRPKPKPFNRYYEETPHGVGIHRDKDGFVTGATFREPRVDTSGFDF